MKTCFFFISKRMTHELRGVRCFSILAILAIFHYFLLFVEWNSRCVTLLRWRNKIRLFYYILVNGIVFFSYLYKFKCLRRERNVTRLLLWMPTIVEGEYEIFVFVKMTLSSIPALQSVVWTTVLRFFFLLHNQKLVHWVLIIFML